MDRNIRQEIIFSTKIKSHSFQSLQLSPNDWIIPSTNTISCIYFYNIKQWASYKIQEDNIFMNIEQLISSLENLLKYYPLLSGTLKSFDEDNKVSVVHDDAKGGVFFVSTTVNLLLSELPISVDSYTHTKIIPESLQLINVGNCDSLFHVRHTRFVCGSVALGITLNHQVADAHSYFQLVRDWTQLYRNLNYQPSVCHQRSLLESSLEQIEMLKQSNPNFAHRRSFSVNDDISSSVPSTKQSIMKVFRFTAAELHRMKSDAMTHLPFNVPYLSTFEVLTAHLYRHVILARHPTTSSTSKLYISTNIRPRLTQTEIPNDYFGNAIVFSYSEMQMTEFFDKNCLSALASKVHTAIEENTKNEIRTTLAWIGCQRDRTKIVTTWNLDETDFFISAWNKMRMYSDSQFEFGLCPCRIILPQDMKFNGAAILFSTEKHDGSIDVFLGLDVNEMEQLEKNSEFRKYREE